MTRRQEPRNNAAVTPAQAGAQLALRQAEGPQGSRRERKERRCAKGWRGSACSPPGPLALSLSKGRLSSPRNASGQASQCFDKLSTSGCEGQSDAP